MDLINRLRQLDGNFYPAEQCVATIVLGDLVFACQASVAQIARQAKVSEPTVIRFCRTAGCRGFKDFKHHLTRNLAVSLQYIRANDEDIEGVDAIIDHVFGAILDGLNMVRAQIDLEAMGKAIEIFANAKQIMFYGVGGGSSIVAKDASNRFFRLRIPSSSHSDGYLQRMTAATLGIRDVVVAISTTGTPHELIEAATTARQYQAKVVCLTKPSSPLAEVADILIPVDIPEDPDIYKPTASRIVFLAIIDVLADGVGRRRSEIAKETMRRIRLSMASVHEDEIPKPIGD